VSNALHFLVTLTWCKDVVVSQRFSNCKDTARKECQDIEERYLNCCGRHKKSSGYYDEYAFYHNDWREKSDDYVMVVSS